MPYNHTMSVAQDQKSKQSSDLTVGYLADLLQRAGFIDEKQRRELDPLDKQTRLQARSSRSRGDESSTPFKAITALNLTDATGKETRIDDLLMARLVAEDAGRRFHKIDPLKLDIEFIEDKISRPFARRHKMVPLSMKDGKLLVAMVNPFDIQALELYREMVRQDLDVVVACETDILRVINEYYGFRAAVTKAERDMTSGFDLSNLEQFVRLKSNKEIEASDQHIVNAVDFLLQHAYDSRASDIHIEPKREHAMIRFRIDGVLHEIYRTPKIVNLAVTSRLKTMCRMDIAEKRRPQDGRIKTEHQGKEIELRVSTLPTAFGEKVVMRIFDPEILVRDLVALGFYEDEYATFNEWIRRPHGIILVTGPTGSGKTVTLYSTLRHLYKPTSTS
jgi:general secretion pathway protein E